MTEHYRYYTNPNGFGNIVQKTNKQTGEINLEGETCPLRLLPPAYIPVILTITDGKIRKFTKYEKIPNSTQTMAVDYFYDALGRRIAKKIKTPSREFTQTYSYIGNEDKILFAKKGNGDVQMEVDGQGIDEHLGEITIAGIKTFASDHLGTVINGEVVGAKKATGAFGEILSNLNQIETTSNPTLYGYTGRQLDQESGIYYYRNRYYDSQSGRFLSKDPSGISGGDVNLYRYVQNKPLILIDPYGLQATEDGNDESQDETSKLNKSFGDYVDEAKKSAKETIQDIVKGAEKQKENAKKRVGDLRDGAKKVSDDTWGFIKKNFCD